MSNPSPDPGAVRGKDRDLLRRAGEHLGTLAEQAHEQLSWTFSDHRKRVRWSDEYARLSRLSRELLEIAR
jgi:hypothetical protein